MNREYKDYILEYVQQFPCNEPIYNALIAENLAKKFNVQVEQTKKIVNVNLKRLFDKDKLERFQKGIYYKTTLTPFGKMKLDPALVVRDRYIKNNGNIIGYETDASFFNRIGLNTQMPRYMYIATYLGKRGYGVKEKLHIILRKAPTEVTTDNHFYLQILDAVENKNNISINADNPENIFVSYIKKRGLDIYKLQTFASKYYPKRVLRKINE